MLFDETKKPHGFKGREAFQLLKSLLFYHNLNEIDIKMVRLNGM
jgi:hypothetical protein